MPAAGPEAMAVGPTNWPLAVPYDPQAVTKRYDGAATAVLLSVNASTARGEAKNSADDRVKAVLDATPGQDERDRRLWRFADRGNRPRNGTLERYVAPPTAWRPFAWGKGVST